MEHITYIGEVVEKLADYSSFPELFIKYEEGDPIPSGKAIHAVSYTHLTLPTNREV